jgi:hypothetical protein
LFDRGILLGFERTEGDPICQAVTETTRSMLKVGDGLSAAASNIGKAEVSVRVSTRNSAATTEAMRNTGDGIEQAGNDIEHAGVDLAVLGIRLRTTGNQLSERGFGLPNPTTTASRFRDIYQGLWLTLGAVDLVLVAMIAYGYWQTWSTPSGLPAGWVGIVCKQEGHTYIQEDFEAL